MKQGEHCALKFQNILFKPNEFPMRFQYITSGGHILVLPALTKSGRCFFKLFWINSGEDFMELYVQMVPWLTTLPTRV